MDKTKICINCHRKLINKNNTWLCIECNSEDLELSQIFTEDSDIESYIFLECPGATIYKDGSNEVEAGVRFYDHEKPDKGFEIIGKPTYAPTHKKKRRIKKDQVGRICRCQGCQDYTVRMRRREGADFFIPSTKYPGRKKLKSVHHVAYEP
jgi:hypothetical protein